MWVTRNYEEFGKSAALQHFHGETICILHLRKQLLNMPPGREGQMLEPHITAHSGIRCDRLCPFIAKLTSFTAIIIQSCQHLTELNGLNALKRDG